MWLIDKRFKLADYWKPDKAKIVIDVKIEPEHIIAFHVDPDYPVRWREEPWHGDIRHIARAGLEGRQGEKWITVVMIRNETIQIGF